MLTKIFAFEGMRPEDSSARRRQSRSSSTNRPLVLAAPKSASAAKLTIPAGTTLVVRLQDTVTSRSRKGSRFGATLEYDLPVGGKTALKGGTKLYGKVYEARHARRAVGQSVLDIRLNQIIVGNTPLEVSTSKYEVAGERSIKKAARGAAAGAAIGAIAGDPGMGAAIGATAGAMRRGQGIEVRSGTLLEFNLTKPITVPSA